MREERAAEVSARRRVSGGLRTRRDPAEDFAEDFANDRADGEAGPVPPWATGRVRITLPRSFAGTKAGRWLALGAFAGMLGAVGAGAWIARHYLLEDARFFVPASTSVEILGNRHLTRAQLLSVFGEDVDRNILTVPMVERRAELERLPWVEHATVMRLLPHTLRIAITERTPVAFYRQGGRIGLVDGSGVLLDMRVDDEPGQARYSFPVLSGIDAAEPLTTRAARMRIFERFMTAMRDAGGGIAERLSEVDLSSPEDVKALVPVAGGSDVLVHFGDDEFLARYRRFQENLPKWRTEYPKLESADMRYPRQVVLEMKPGTAVPVVSAAEAVVAGKSPTSAKPLVVKGKAMAHAAAAHPHAPHLQTAYDAPAKPHTVPAVER